MEKYFLLFAFVVAFVVAFATTPFAKAFAIHFDAVDRPEARRINKKTIPRMGGLAIFYGFIVSVLAFCDIDRSVSGIILGALIIVAVGIIDDIKQLSAKIKLPFQILAAVVLCLHGVTINFITAPEFISPSGILPLGVWSYPVTVIWIVGVTNAVNLIDGLDGLAAGLSSIASMSLFCIALIVGDFSVAIITAALAGACFGFLPYNFNPAKIFMGDTGSTFLGFILASVSILGVFKGYAVISFAVPFLVLGLPLFDTGAAIVRRIKNKKPIMEPDKEHLHHKLLAMGFSQKRTVLILYVIATVLGLSAIVLIGSGPWRAVALVSVVLIIIISSAVFSSRAHKNEENETDAIQEEKDD